MGIDDNARERRLEQKCFKRTIRVSECFFLVSTRQGHMDKGPLNGLLLYKADGIKNHKKNKVHVHTRTHLTAICPGLPG